MRVQAQTLAAADRQNIEAATAAGGTHGSAAFEQSRVGAGKLRDQAQRLKFGGK